ncbi:MAG: ABC transporter permease, partial [Anaerolineales bacterium]|nr:ABC transporter permease [Anaerolineales bacterium]
MTKRARGRLTENVRILWVLVSKDIVGTVRNKNTLGVLLPTLFLVVFYRAMPLFVFKEEQPTVLLYDAGQSRLTEAMRGSPNLSLYEYPSQAVMEEKLAVGGDEEEIGLVIPANLDELLDAGDQLELEGYVLNWVSDSAAQFMKSYMEEEIADLVEQPVQINVEENTVYVRPDSFGFPFFTAEGLIIVIMMIGVSLTPNLIFEEKQSKTMDALMVSPANDTLIIVAKSLTGLFYCFAAGALVLALSIPLLMHWGLTILTVLVGSLFAVSLGLFFGSIFEVRQQMMIWGFTAFAVLLIPTFLTILEPLVPVVLVDIMQWIPTVALLNVVRGSLAESAPFIQYGPWLLLVLGYTVLILGAVVWINRRAE